MKRKTLTLIISISLMAQFIVTVSSGFPVGLYDSNDMFGTNPVTAYEVESSDLIPAADDYFTVDGFWTDLVDTEKVSQDGSGVYVAVLDTGLLPNWPTLFPNQNIAWELGKGFSHDFYWDEDVGDIMVSEVKDDRGYITDLASGHGTHVTSTVVGYDFFGTGIAGVAPEATIIPVLVLDAWVVDTPFGPQYFSGGTNDMIASGITYVADLSETLDGPVVINMSLGGPNHSALIEAAIDYAISKGVIVVTSAGNEGEAGLGYPGALDQVISVASVGWTGEFVTGWTSDVPEDLNTEDALGNNHQLYLSDFSSRPNKDLGQKHSVLDVAAPGHWIVGPYKSTWADNANWGYYYVSGTSMASPHVAGIAALVLQAFPNLNQGDMEFILKNAAHGNPLPSDGTWNYVPFYADPFVFYDWNGGDYGSGFLTAENALFSAARHA